MSSRQVIGYLIDPEAQTVEEVEHEDTLDAWYRLLGCQYVEEHRLATGDVLIVDEDGGLKAQTAAFRAPMLTVHAFVGKGLIVGVSAGGNTAAKPKAPITTYRPLFQFARKP